MTHNLSPRPGKLKLASILPSKPVKLVQKADTAIFVSPVINPFRLIGGFGNHKFLFVFEIPPSTIYDIIHGLPAGGAPAASIVVYDFGSQVNVEYEFPMRFILYRLGDTPLLHFRSVMSSENDDGVERVAPIFRDIKKSTLSVCIIDEKGNILQPEKFGHCQNGPKGGLCFRIKDFLSIEDIESSASSFLTKRGSLILRIEFLGFNLSPKSQVDNSKEGTLQYDSDTKYRNLMYQLVRDEDFNSFLRSWASNTKFANVSLRIQEKAGNAAVIPAHRVLLSAQSDALGGYLRPREEVVVLEGCHRFTLLVMLDYIYSGEIHCNDLVTLVNLAELGDKLKVYGLKGKCVRDIIMMFNEIVTNIKHIVCCYKLGEMLDAPSLIDKAVECFRVMKTTNKCIDFPYAKALMGIAACKSDDEFNKILNSLYEKSLPVKETIRNLVQLPSDEVKLLGTSAENWTGYIYVIPGPLCKTISEVCMTVKKLTLIQKLEVEDGFFEFVKNSEDGINLRVTSLPENNSSNEEDELQLTLRTLGITKSDYLSVLAENIGMLLKASLFDSTGRIITANHTRGVLISGDSYCWEINSFITPKMMLKHKWDGVNEMLLRLCFGSTQLHPTFRIISPNDNRFIHFRKFDASFLQKVNLDPYVARLLSQLEYAADADATINVVNYNHISVFRAPVHAVVLSAMSSYFEESFTASLELKLQVKGYTVETIQMLLRYIYGENISPGHIGLALELISAAEEFGIKGLRDKCIDKLCSAELNLDTCIHLYEIGSETNSMPLQDVAIGFFRRNRQAVDKFKEFKDFIKRHPNILESISVD